MHRLTIRQFLLSPILIFVAGSKRRSNTAYRLQHDEVGYGQRTGDAKVLLLKILVETDLMLLGTMVQIELGRRIF